MAGRSILVPAALLAAGAAFMLDERRSAHRVEARRVATDGAKHRVVIAGAGFGGLEAARRLGRVPGLQVTLLDEHNHHLFQPLLYQVATSALEPGDIASPVRSIVPPVRGVEVLMEKVTGLDLAAREVVCGERRVSYDTLVLATGSQPSYFGHDDWRDAAPGLKTLDDALELRRRILGAFEAAVVADDPAERERPLTFVVVGGGTTGVEMAGSLAELAQEMLRHDFRDVLLPWQGRRARVLLVEGGKRLLPGFPPDLAARALADLHHLGVEVRTGAEVTALARGRVQVGQESIPAGTVVWAAGVAATPVAAWLGVAPGRGGRVPVGPDLQVPDRPGIYVIGDAALVHDRQGRALPGVAPVAKQQGAYVARAVRGRLLGRRAPRPFAYRDYGTLATIGRNKALAEFGPVHLTGFVAWVTWAVAHIFFLIGFRNRVLVSAQWLFAYVTHRRGARVIM